MNFVYSFNFYSLCNFIFVDASRGNQLFVVETSDCK